MGAIFPEVIWGLGVPKSIALSPTLIVISLIAGFIVGGLNFGLVSRTVRPRLKQLSAGMQQVRVEMQKATFSGYWAACNPAVCRSQEQDQDELGAVAQSYNAWLYALHDAYMVDACIRDFNQTLSSKLDLNELGDQALALLQASAHAQGGAIVLERKDELTVLVSRSLSHPEKLVESTVSFNLKDQSVQTRITLPLGMTVDAILSHFVPSDVLLTPIENQGRVLGWAILASATPFAENVPRLMSLLSQGLGLALKNALLHDELQSIAALDPLTSVYNRRFGFKRLEEELTRAFRDHSALSVLLLDLDHFKRVNDIYGHLCGDRVLINTANVCREILREGDVLIRYGGEEFVVVLPGASIQEARDVAERICLAISQTQIDLNGQSLQVTSSIGVAATTGQKVIAADELIVLADERLYKAKATGRNRVVS